jgi:diadenosine tetraphosphate (Ap4A) HIT family hydrolase
MHCPFCAIPTTEILWESSLLVAIRDRFPLNPGHSLIVPRRHVADWLGATRDEQQQLVKAVDEVRAILQRERPADGYNVGFNAGVAAGQTVLHAHLHVIPRFVGDVPDPRGGIRHVVPQRARYWETRS